MNIPELVERLREWVEESNNLYDFQKPLLIQAADTIESLQAELAPYNDMGHDCVLIERDRDKLQARVKELESPWISVEDGLPEYGKCVMIFSKGCGPHIDYLKTSNLFTADHLEENTDYHATHWMPLPEPPE